jgi:hypothetical protein
MDTVTCIFVINGKEAFRKDLEHPGMDSINVEYEEVLPPRPQHPKDKGKEVPPNTIKRIGRFYWDHMDARGNHVFRMDGGFTGEVL